MQKRITEVKEKISQKELSIVPKPDEATLRNEAELFIKERKYKKAFIQLKEILSYYQEQLIAEEVELDFGININN